MFGKILLAYNGSADSAVALHRAGELARLSNSELHILGIVEITSGSILAQSAGGGVDILGMQREHLAHLLETAANDLKAQGVKVDFAVRDGDPAVEIVNYAHQIKADLTVLGHTDRGRIARWFQGSVGAKLLSDLPCNLLIATKS
jgi:nucleotide-binding universal stress UspA family protein